MIALSSFWVLLHARPRCGSPWTQCEQGDPLGHFERAPQAHCGLSTLPLLLPWDCMESISIVRGYQALACRQEPPPRHRYRGAQQETSTRSHTQVCSCPATTLHGLPQLQRLSFKTEERSGKPGDRCTPEDRH